MHGHSLFVMEYLHKDHSRLAQAASSPTDGMTCNSVIALDAGALNSENSVKN
jgi:hypothetical protein